LSSALLQVLKVLNDNVARTGVRANNIHSEIKATCSSLSAEYDQIFGQPENEPKFGVETTVSQAWCSTITTATSADTSESLEMKIGMQCTEPQQHAAGRLPSI